MPEYIFLKINMNILKFVGIKTVSNKKWKKYHKVFAQLSMVYLCTFVMTEHYEVYRTLGDDLFDTVSNLGVSLLYSIGIAKILVCRGKRVTYLLDEIQKTERSILEGDESEDKVKKIYWDYAKFSEKLCRYFLYLGVCTTVPFYVQPYLQEPFQKIRENGNSTEYYFERPLPLVSYFPFNTYKYYFIAYTLHVFAGTCGASSTIATDILFYALFIYVRSQIAILQLRFKEFKKYSLTLQKKEKCSFEEAVEIFIGKCVEDHNYLIQ